MDENSDNTLSYTEKDLYGPSGVPMSSDLEQHQMGDCYFIAPLGSLAHQQPQRIEHGISYNADKNTFSVTLYQETHTGFLHLHDTAKPVQVEVTQADLQTDLSLGGDSLRSRHYNPDTKAPLWPAVYEAAYAKMSEHSKEDIKQGFDRIGGGAGGQPSDAIYALTGSRTDILFSSDINKLGLDGTYSKIDTALKEGRPVLLGTNPMKETPSDGLIRGDWDKQTGHAYT